MPNGRPFIPQAELDAPVGAERWRRDAAHGPDGPHGPRAAIRPGLAHARGAAGDLVDGALFWAFIAALAWCPFWFGGNDLLAWGINAIAFPGLAAVYEISVLARGQRHPVAIRQIAGPAALFGAVVIFILVQSSTSAPPPMDHPIWQMAAETLDGAVEGSVSVNRDLTTVALLRLVTGASAFWLSLQLCRNSRRAYLLLYSVAMIAAVYALYGLIAFALTPGYVLWLPVAHARGYVSASFINHNSFATYAGMGLIATCGLILRLYRHQVASEGGPAGFKIASFIEVTGREGALLLAMGFVITAALMLSGSRGGILATGLGLFVLGMLSLQRRRGARQDHRETILFVAVLLAAAFVAFGDVVAGKIAQQGLGDDNRIAAYKIILGAISDAPFSGFGYGTFADVFPLYRDRSVAVHGKWVMAHNSYLEVFQDLGVVFGAMLIAALAMLAYQTMKGATTRQSSATVPCVATAVAFLAGVHSLVDFSLQIQAVALTFAALLGAGVAQSVSSRVVVSD